MVHCKVIAEVGVNHNGNLWEAKELLREAAHAGADAVKFQMFSAENLERPELEQYEITAWEMENIAAECSKIDIEFMCTPFDKQAVDFLDPLVKTFKIGSGQAGDLDFVQYVASKGKPMIISLGMLDHKWELKVPVSWLHCVSLYPCPPEKANLQRMVKMKLDGYSDHTEGIEIALAAAALGAKIIEKHITLDKTQAGPDHICSAEPDEFKALVKGIRKIELAEFNSPSWSLTV